MRRVTTMALGLLIAAPVASFGLHARAAGNDPNGQVQGFVNNRGNDHDAVQTGRDDQTRRRQAERDRYRWDEDQQSDSEDYYRSPNYGYRNGDR
jgi:hypothetical protein